MDYEKEYKSLVAKVKKAHLFAQTDSTKKVLEDILPQLRESEDERIRKVIYKLMLVMREEIFTSQDEIVTKEKVLAYLEKQKENPKNADSIPEDCASNARCPYKIHGDEDFIGDIKDTPAYHFGFDEGVRSEREKQKEPEKEELVYRLNGLMQEYINEAKDQEEEEHRFKCYKLFWDALEDASYFEQKEQKPVECVTDAEMKKGLDELTKFKCFASALSDMYNIIPSHSSLRPKDIDWNNFCAGLLTYLKRELPVEWSEEDERILKGIIGKIDHDQTYGVSKVEMLSFLKSLRPSWKPSEEQMKALDKAIPVCMGIVGKDEAYPLISLYEQLKKL